MTVLHSIRQQSGVTLVELILSMVIISVALVGILSVINLTVRRSADPVVQHQAVSIAEAYLEEILLKRYCDPDFSVGCTNTKEVSRALYDAVDDYHGLNDSGVHDQQGKLITTPSHIITLTDYIISVTVDSESLINAVAAKKITVAVSGPGGAGLSLVGYKFR